MEYNPQQCSACGSDYNHVNRDRWTDTWDYTLSAFDNRCPECLVAAGYSYTPIGHLKPGFDAFQDFVLEYDEDDWFGDFYDTYDERNYFSDYILGQIQSYDEPFADLDSGLPVRTPMRARGRHPVTHCEPAYMERKWVGALRHRHLQSRGHSRHKPRIRASERIGNKMARAYTARWLEALEWRERCTSLFI